MTYFLRSHNKQKGVCEQRLGTKCGVLVHPPSHTLNISTSQHEVLRSGVAHFFFHFFLGVLWAPYQRSTTASSLHLHHTHAHHFLLSVVCCALVCSLGTVGCWEGRQGGCGLELCMRRLRVCGSQLAVCLVSLFCVCVSLVRVVIICPASTHTALVSSPSLAVLHLSTYLPARCRWRRVL